MVAGYHTVMVQLQGRAGKILAVFTTVWAWLLLGEEHFRERLLGATVMVLGGALVAT